MQLLIFFKIDIYHRLLNHAPPPRQSRQRCLCSTMTPRVQNASALMRIRANPYWYELIDIIFILLYLFCVFLFLLRIMAMP